MFVIPAFERKRQVHLWDSLASLAERETERGRERERERERERGAAGLHIYIALFLLF